MIPIHELLNKIRWDSRERKQDYVLVYIDMNERKELPYTAIIRTEERFMVVRKDDNEVMIPMHRVREVRKRGMIVWQREPAGENND